MDGFKALVFLLCLSGLLILSGPGCRGTQARVMKSDEQDKVASDRAGAEVYNPMVRCAVAKLLERAASEPVRQVSYHNGELIPAKRKVCFISLENASIEELGDFKEHIRTAILEGISEAQPFELVSDRAVTAGLRALRFRPDDLFMQENMQMFTGAMGRDGNPVDYLLFAKITSGTTVDRKDMQRDYKLTLELINTHTFVPIIESMPMRKEYNHSVKGKVSGWFKKKTD